MSKLLVVEDDADIRTLIVKRLENAGHAVLAAGSAEEAMVKVGERGVPDLAVLDVGLPGMTGLEFLVLLRKEIGVPGLPAVFLSARVTPSDIEAGRSLRATYLTKPFVAKALVAAVSDALGNNGW